VASHGRSVLEPVGELGEQIRPVPEAARPEKGAFDELDEVFDTAFLVARVRIGGLRKDTDLLEESSEVLIIVDALLAGGGVLVPVDHRRLGVVDDIDQRQAAQGAGAAFHPSDQALGAFPRDEADMQGAAVLQAARIEGERLGGAIGIGHGDRPEIVLGKLAGHPLEPHHRRRGRRGRTGLFQIAVDRILARLVGVLRAQAAEELRALDRGLSGEFGLDLLSQRGGELGRPSRPRVFAKFGFQHRGHGLLVNDAPLRARRHPAEPLNAVGVQTRVPSAQNQRASGGGMHG